MSHNTFSEWRVKYAAHVLRQGGVIAYPTEAVWGLGCLPSDEHAVHRILHIKQRPMSKGVILISGQSEHFWALLKYLPEELQDRFTERQSQPTTWLVPDVNNQVPVWVKGQHGSVAVRVTAHPQVAALTKALGSPIVSTSANPAGKAPALSAFKIRQYFHGELDDILPAKLGGYSSPSVIRDLRTNQIIRF